MKLEVFGEEEEGYHFGRRMTDIYNPSVFLMHASRATSMIIGSAAVRPVTLSVY